MTTGTITRTVAVSGSVTDQVIQAAWGPAMQASGGPTGKVRVIQLIIQGAATPGTVQINTKGSGAGTPLLAPITPSATTPTVITAGAESAAVCQTNIGEALTVSTVGATGTTTINVTYEYRPGF